MEDINDIFAAEEARLLAEGQAAIAAEDAAWDALPQAERDRLAEESAARWAALFSALDREAEEEDAEDDDAEQDDDDDQ